MGKLVRLFSCLLLLLSLCAMSMTPVLANPDADLIGQLEVNEVYTNIANQVVVNVPDPGESVNDFQVKLEVSDGGDYTEIATNNVSGTFAWGDTATTFSWTPTADGDYTLRATVDSSDNVTETNEDNNQVSQAITAATVSAKTVTVRVEGQTSTIWSDNVTFTTSTITDKYGDTYTLDYPTAMGALHAASVAGDFSLIIDSMFGPIDYVESVDGESCAGLNGWMYRVNWDNSNLGAKEYAVSDGDVVLFSYTAWGSQPLRTTVSSNNVLSGNSVNITVEAYDGTDWNAADNVTVYVSTLTYTTDTNGQVLNLTLNPGSYTVYADKGDSTVNIRSNKETVNVYVPLTLKAGWNFISVPKRLASGYSTAQQVFGSVDTAGHSIFAYDGTDGWTAMSSDNVVSPLEGIWIYSAAEVELHPAFDTNPRQVPPTKQLSAGWNAIGFSDFTAASADSALTSVEDDWTVLIGFYTDNQTYEVSIINDAPTGDAHDEDRELNCWKGYWLHVTTACQLAAISS
ncbi:CARDB domain-containing protein [Chloroflexota bacterium]